MDSFVYVVLASIGTLSALYGVSQRGYMLDARAQPVRAIPGGRRLGDPPLRIAPVAHRPIGSHSLEAMSEIDRAA